MYGFPYIEELDGGTLYPGPFYINQDWLDELGHAVPTTVDEFVACLKAFATAATSTERLADEVPYAVNFVTDDALSSQNTSSSFLAALANPARTAILPVYQDQGTGRCFSSPTPRRSRIAWNSSTRSIGNLLDIVGISPAIFPITSMANTPRPARWHMEPVRLPAVRAYTALPRLNGRKRLHGLCAEPSELNTKSVGLITTACDNPSWWRAVRFFLRSGGLLLYQLGPAYYYTDTMQLGAQLIPDEEKTTLVTPRYREAHRSKSTTTWTTATTAGP
jgi:putative aldouronate transport system substrate-binding protein